LRRSHAPGSAKQLQTMLLFRWLLLLLLLAAIVSFMFYAGTGQAKFRRYGLVILKWTLIAAFGFFAVLILERVA
jgi:hypothetical protein